MDCMKRWRRRKSREVVEGVYIGDTTPSTRVETPETDPNDARVWRMAFYGPCTSCGEPRDIRQIKLRQGLYYQLFCPSCKKVAV